MNYKEIKVIKNGLQRTIPKVEEKKLRVFDQNNMKIDAEIKLRNIQSLKKKAIS